MKVKKILSMLITACMLLSFIPVVSVSAETTTEWEYTVGVGISRMKNAECKHKTPAAKTARQPRSLKQQERRGL